MSTFEIKSKDRETQKGRTTTLYYIVFRVLNVFVIHVYQVLKRLILLQKVSTFLPNRRLLIGC